MNPIKMVAIVLIVGGLLGLVYGGFSYTRETHEGKWGPRMGCSLLEGIVAPTLVPNGGG
jgi:hypothetical protein